MDSSSPINAGATINRQEPAPNRIDDLNRVSFYTAGKQEDDRLLLQNQLLDSFDADIYDEVLGRADASLRILDVGCGTGDMLLPKLRGKEGLRFQLFGIDRDDGQIAKARSRYGSSEPGAQVSFECLDIEADDADKQLRTLMNAHDIPAFDVVNLSMVMLHLTDPLRCLKTLRPLLAENGRAIVRDIDDGLNFAYPDQTGCFARLFQIGLQDDLAGDRYSGRKIHRLLSTAGFRNIELRRQGLSTAGLSPQQKEAYFTMSFGILIRHAKALSEKHPNNPELRATSEWATTDHDAIHDLFMQEDFLASLGFMSYVASV